jgi:hypothetical protein
MKVIKPVTITAAMLVSTTAVETYSNWNGATAYVVGNTVVYTTTQRLYERLVSGTTATAPDLDTTNWLDIGPTNKWAMFDGAVSTQTVGTTTLTVVIKPGYVNSVGLFGLEGATVSITERDSLAGAVVYTDSMSLDGAVIIDWYMYFFEPSDQLAEAIFSDLPPYTDGHITVTVTGSTTKVGVLVAGTVYSLGGTLAGATAGIIDYSRKETDEFGVTTFVRRNYSKRMEAKLLLTTSQINKVQRLLADIRATPCAWIASDSAGYEPLTMYGAYRDFSIDVAYADHSYTNLSIEGLT